MTTPFRTTFSDKRRKTLLLLIRRLNENADLFLNTDVFTPTERWEVSKFLEHIQQKHDMWLAKESVRQRYESARILRSALSDMEDEDGN